ncbi:aldose epimerase family protein [Fibrella forsythiae]|uniref:Aldose 1-epimerase n=1 Tax=Fibrella forsythiae TaxID=2817061 RepID=A0ABS3JJ24_9BACT|nr:aldose epimerase family protein [Fibrella forsythiae]MBO0948872.1 galactose mutarotase [Fibrella forsythiae]
MKRRTSFLLLISTVLLYAFVHQKTGIEQSVFGKMPDGREVGLFTLRNAKGMEVKITNYGGYIVSCTVPDRAGKPENVVLGLGTLADYLKGTPSLGPIIGRYGNRIAHGKFTLDGTDYTLFTNPSGIHIHGGKVGFDKKLWDATPVDGAEPALKLQYTSPDGEENYPGTLNVNVTYTLQKDNALRIDYKATTDKATVVNLTNHAYFNLSGMKADVMNNVVMIKADKVLATDKTQVPTGEIRPVAGTPFDFTKPTPIGAHINDTTDTQIRYGKGYDHCWVFTDQSAKLKLGATVFEPTSGRLMEVYTTEPGVQLYTANNLNGSVRSPEGIAYTRRFALCLETQHFPDSPNHPNFPTTTLRPGATYLSTTVYKFKVQK